MTDRTSARTTDRTPAEFATHAIVVYERAAPARDEVRWTNDALSATFDRGDAVELQVRERWLAAEHPDVAARIDEAFRRVAGTRFRGSLPECRPALEPLLSLESVHRFVGLHRLEVRVDGRPLARYRPNRSRVRLDCAAVDGLESDLRERLDGTGAAVLPTETLAEWTDGDVRYELRPPWFRMGRGRRRELADAEAIAVDRERRRLEVDWVATDGLVGRAMRWVAPDCTTTVEFDDPERLEAVADAFALVAERLEIPFETDRGA